ncbi:inovirus Gp2 family protein [Jinshanibacter sp. LJY008]|uniref:Inovirus Gp2 family protein n=1 Tax=Limnobaculum eriocheiris TaxID=2897391 RepID=A0A9X1MTE4_9GAMM|nr:inovirus Gp2 family protein [Limnobaculum eriocheiris]MCD1125201.1 inovirus Gp2 family protein [Limnobaculum eriocheiris]
MNADNIIESYGPLNPDYLNRMTKTIQSALNEHLRTFALRVDLRLPDDVLARIDSAVISRFFDSLKAKLKADSNKKRAEGKRIHHSTLRYVWVREFNQPGEKKHYHVLLLLNKDAYAFLGDYRASEGNLAALITQAWLSALGINDKRYQSLTYFPKNPCYYLDAKTLGINGVYAELMVRVSYLAKERSKVSDDGERNFGCSQG